jgi:hypothetical protein
VRAWTQITMCSRAKIHRVSKLPHMGYLYRQIYRFRKIIKEVHMKVSSFLALAALIAFLFGLGFILAPVQVLSMYAINLDTGGLFITRYLGSAFLGVAVINWLVRNKKSETIKPVLTGDLMFTATALVVAVWDVFGGAGNAMVWTTVAFYLILTIGIVYFLFQQEESPGFVTQN